MGYRLHVHKKHVIEYGQSCFNWDCEEVNHILDTMCDEYHGNSDYYTNDSEIEIPKESFKKMIDMDAEEFKKQFEEYELKVPEPYTIEDLLDVFRGFYEDADPNDDYIHLSWF